MNTSVNIEELKQLFKNAKESQDPYFSSIIQLVERLELQIKSLEEQLAMNE